MTNNNEDEDNEDNEDNNDNENNIEICESYCLDEDVFYSSNIKICHIINLRLELIKLTISSIINMNSNKIETIDKLLEIYEKFLFKNINFDHLNDDNNMNEGEIIYKNPKFKS